MSPEIQAVEVKSRAAYRTRIVGFADLKAAQVFCRDRMRTGENLLRPACRGRLAWPVSSTELIVTGSDGESERHHNGAY